MLRELTGQWRHLAELKPRIKRLFGRNASSRQGSDNCVLTETNETQQHEPQYKRFLTDNPLAYQAAIDAAESYASRLGDREHSWLFSKPFDATPGNSQYFRLMYDLLNLLQAMRLPANARILEIGSGPGWVTEILLMMGFSVDALEPSGDLIDIAKERCESLKVHYHFDGEPDVRYHQDTLELVELREQSFDAVLYFDVLHHVVEEQICIEKSFRFLRPGGCVGIVDPSWHPAFKPLEDSMIAEMAKYGTLENPFSVQYIDQLLTDAGFVNIERYISVNGMFSAEELKRPLQDFSDRPLAGSNNMTARRPYSDGIAWPNCASPNFKSDARLTLLSGGIDPASRRATLTVQIQNNGETLFDSCPDRTGRVNFALRRSAPGTPDFIQSLNRVALPENLPPGQTLEVTMTFKLPAGEPLDDWELDLVAEAVFWFSARGMSSCPVPVI